MGTLLPSGCLGRQGICVVPRLYQQRVLRPRAQGGAGRAFLPSNRGPAALGGRGLDASLAPPLPALCPRSALLGRCLPRGDLASADWGKAGLGTTPVPAPGAAFPPAGRAAAGSHFGAGWGDVTAETRARQGRVGEVELWGTWGSSRSLGRGKGNGRPSSRLCVPACILQVRAFGSSSRFRALPGMGARPQVLPTVTRRVRIIALD